MASVGFLELLGETLRHFLLACAFRLGSGMELHVRYGSIQHESVPGLVASAGFLMRFLRQLFGLLCNHLLQMEPLDSLVTAWRLGTIARLTAAFK